MANEFLDDAGVLDGGPDPLRRDTLETSPITRMDGWLEYRKRTTIYAKKMRSKFAVRTMEGLMTGKAGDWLAVGVAGEMYPIDNAVFVESYEAVPDQYPHAAPDSNDVAGPADTLNPNTPEPENQTT